ncbi:hypothetical protein Btru_073247 [Bulinus truncatus]|nr:hypothetical protein Btru_073247 [Bulinus truncatus]
MVLISSEWSTNHSTGWNGQDKVPEVSVAVVGGRIVRCAAAEERGEKYHVKDKYVCESLVFEKVWSLRD